MVKILVVYFSRTGNTERMASAIAEGAREDAHVELHQMFESPKDIESFDGVIFGTPTYHHSLTHNVKEFLEELAFRQVNLKNKVGAAFGSHGWSEEAPNLVLEILKNKFEMDVIEQPLLVKYTPDEKGLSKCREFGKKVVQQILKSSQD